MTEETKDKKSYKAKTAEKRCFVMMPFSDQGDYPKGHFQMVYKHIFIPAIKKAGYTPYRVDENTISDSIINKIFEGVQNCEMALCDLSNRNPNVLYELGLRQAYNKPVVLVKDEKTENIFDVSVISTIQYNSNRLYENVVEAQEKIYESLKSTGEGNDTTLVQFVRANEASYDDVKVNEDNATNIMLQSIMKELQQLNSSKTNTNIPIYKNYNNRKIELFFRNKNNLNLEKVSYITENLFNEYSVEIFKIRDLRDRISIILSQNDFNLYSNQIINYLEEHIGTFIDLKVAID